MLPRISNKSTPNTFPDSKLPGVVDNNRIKPIKPLMKPVVAMRLLVEVELFLLLVAKLKTVELLAEKDKKLPMEVVKVAKLTVDLLKAELRAVLLVVLKADLKVDLKVVPRVVLPEVDLLKAAKVAVLDEGHKVL